MGARYSTTCRMAVYTSATPSCGGAAIAFASKSYLPSPPNPSDSNESLRSAPRDELVFAHLTDPHLTRPDPVNAADLANKRILGYLSWRRRRHAIHRSDIIEALVTDLHAQSPDHIAVTGDLTQIGLPGECRDARTWLENLGPSGKVSVVPGNHDQYVDAPWKETLGLWYDYMASDAGSASNELFPSIRVRGPVAFVGVSSVYPCPPLLATGRVGKTQREALEKVLRETSDRGLCRVVLIHHPPVPDSYKWRKRLEDARETCAILRSAGADLVLHGHTHRLMLNELRSETGSLPVFGLSSASAGDHEFERRARYFLYRVSRDDHGIGITWSSRVFDPESAEFRMESDWRSISQIAQALRADQS